MGDMTELEISRLGAQGDGIGGAPDVPIYVPYTLPGEIVRADVDGERGRLIEIVRPSAARIAPICRHFTICGGCAMQHLRADDYLAWKREQVKLAFAARGIDAVVEPVFAVAPGGRRRAVFSAVLPKSEVILGFHAARGDVIVDLEECPVVEPAIVAALPGLRDLLVPLLSRRREARVIVVRTEAGLDVAVEDAGHKLTPELRVSLARKARSMGLLRFTLDGETIYAGGDPVLRFGLAEVVPVPGVFLQADATAEAEMIHLVKAATAKAKNVADLFAGVGTFTFPLAERAKVFAVDSDRRATASLDAAVRRTQGLKPITTKTRDLFREPLSPKELEPFDAVVFDPPRAGAEAQARMLARSKVKTIVAVSCNPATLARDARVLIDGGYKLGAVSPIDQFVFSAHIEAAAVLRR